MNDDRRSRWRGPRVGRNNGCGCGFGCGGFLVVLTVGIALSVSARIPFTHSNVTLAASIGAKDKAAGALPDYTYGRLGGNQNFINNSTTLTIGPAEGAAVIVIGKQGGAPVLDLHLVLR